jgi:uncharacterized membrane protein SpoIIM required for sporulation
MSTAEQLESFLRSVDSRSLRNVSRAELRAFPVLYRRLVSELAESRARGVPGERLADLEALIARAHAVLYAPLPIRLSRSLAELVVAFPGSVRRSWRYLAVATALLTVGTAWGYLEVSRDPASAAILLPGGSQKNAEESFQQDATPREGDPVYGVFYFTNNARVALNAYALGATFGAGTVAVLLFNGIVLGATFAVVHMVASPRAFFEFVLPHAGVELTAILVAAAGGLRMADGLVRPGWLRRRDAFARAARDSLPLALGAAALLSIAGLVEGWISPMPWPLLTKASIGIGLDVLLLVYIVMARPSPQVAG